MAAPPKRFSLFATRISMTWPQCDWKKERVLDHLQATFGANLRYAIVCEEKHADGQPHIHAGVFLYQAFRTRNARVFDLGPHHGEYQGIRSPKDWINYVKKDGNWIDHGTSPVVEKKLERREKLMYIRTHTLEECTESGLFSLAELCHAWRLKAQLEAEQWRWPFWKKRQVLWFYGETGTGKTRLATAMAARSGVSWTILGGDLRQFMNPYKNEEFVIIDDLRAGAINFEQLLRLTDGYRVAVNIKGATSEWLASTIIITAPKAPADIFWNHEKQRPWDKLDQLLRRIDGIRNFDEQPFGSLPDDEPPPAVPPEEEPRPATPEFTIDLEAPENEYDGLITGAAQ